MALELRQQLKLAQQLVMTPQLQQAIRLLQLSRVELLETVQQELMENPFLEELAVDPNADSQGAELRKQTEGDREAYDQEVARNADWEDYLGDFSSTSRQSSMREAESFEDENSFEARYSLKPTLEGHLNWQLRLSSSLSEKQKLIGETIIGNLAPNGYLHATLEDIAGAVSCSTEEVEHTLKIIQQFDPVGVASRTPQECLLVQLAMLNYDRDPVLVSLVTEHLEDLEDKRYKPILRKFKLTPEDLREYLDIIQTLDPMPGSSYGGSEPNYVSPDVFVYRLEDVLIIALNDDGLPQLHLSSTFEYLLPAAT